MVEYLLQKIRIRKKKLKYLKQDYFTILLPNIDFLDFSGGLKHSIHPDL
jgi:hypothetical protein